MADAQYFNNNEVVSGATTSSDVENKTYEKAIWATRITEIPSNMQMRVAYDGSGNAEYVAFAPRGLASSDTGWMIQKFTYDGSNRATLRQIAYDNWDNRTGASYG